MNCKISEKPEVVQFDQELCLMSLYHMVRNNYVSEIKGPDQTARIRRLIWTFSSAYAPIACPVVTHPRALVIILIQLHPIFKTLMQQIYQSRIVLTWKKKNKLTEARFCLIPLQSHYHKIIPTPRPPYPAQRVMVCFYYCFMWKRSL